MKYMLLIYSVETTREADHPDQDAMMNEYWAFTENLQKNGQYISGDALQPTMTATTVRVRNGATNTSDGPFAETKEQLGGYYLVEAKDLDEAIGLAAQIPDARNGCVEVRPLMQFDMPQG
ncbi:MAG: YciI family protein [Dehalococcoidia bacterium]|nr:YciI family protein [Dehalococcoidia bacterium]HRC63467.1 YciI family protein [Dehalococcoidia bacterium]